MKPNPIYEMIRDATWIRHEGILTPGWPGHQNKGSGLRVHLDSLWDEVWGNGYAHWFQEAPCYFDAWKQGREANRSIA